MPNGYRLVSGGNPEEFGDKLGVDWRWRFLACSRQFIFENRGAYPNRNPSCDPEAITALEKYHLGPLEVSDWRCADVTSRLRQASLGSELFPTPTCITSIASCARSLPHKTLAKSHA